MSEITIAALVKAWRQHADDWEAAGIPEGRIIANSYRDCAAKLERLPITYRGFVIEPNTYASIPGFEWQWREDDDHYDGQPLRFERTPEACREAIDDELAEQN